MKKFLIPAVTVALVALAVDAYAHSHGGGAGGGLFAGRRARVEQRRAGRSGGHGAGGHGMAMAMPVMAMPMATMQMQSFGCAGMMQSFGCDGVMGRDAFGRPAIIVPPPRQQFMVPPGFKLVPIDPPGKPPEKDFKIKPAEELSRPRLEVLFEEPLPAPAPALSFRITPARAPAPAFQIIPATVPVSFDIKPAPVKRTYVSLREEALKENKPLVVWVGYGCHSTRDQLPGMLHHVAASDDWNGFKGPGVLVGVPGGDGGLYQCDWITADEVCAAVLRRSVERTIRSWGAPPPTEEERRLWQMESYVNVAYTLAPQAMMAPIPQATVRHVRGWTGSRDGVCRG